MVILLSACGGTSVEAREPEPTPPVLCAGVCVEGDVCRQGPIEWRCACTLHHDRNCGGAARELAPPHWAWSCEPIDPRSDRGDGCPYGRPTADTACEGPRQCRYPDDVCGWSGTDAACIDGRWQLAPFDLPPPP